MKKAYQKPCMEMELYALDASIASNCSNTVTLGPALGEHSACKEYDFGSFSMVRPYSERTSFYDDYTCTCYYTAGGDGLFTS